MPVSFGPYELTNRLEIGGMAETFIATRRGPGDFEQHVCLKRILPSMQNDPEFIREFMNEAQLAAQLRHANIVQVVDFGEVKDEGHYLALELIDGIDLQRLLKALRAKSRFSLDIAIFIAAQVASALEFAHRPTKTRAAVIHRDISASNVLLSREGSIYLSDFGIARAMGSRRRTRTGIRRGKTPYLSPEYLATGAFDERSDLYALGVLFYEMVCGQRPFDGETDALTFRNIREGHRAPVAELRSETTIELRNIIDTLLSLSPQQRYPNATALLDALSPILPTLNTKRDLAVLVTAHADHARSVTPIEAIGYTERYRAHSSKKRKPNTDITAGQTKTQPSSSGNRRVARFGDAQEEDVRFVVDRRLGGGSFGDVYRVYDRERKTTLALKTLRALGPNALYRFKREFRALADISHPNLVSLYELFQGEDGWFFTMDYVAGKELLTHLAGRDSPPSITPEIGFDATLDPGSDTLPIATGNAMALDLDRVRAFFAQIVQGLLALHREGMVHRDLKPSNVMVDAASGQVRILDFGLVTDVEVENRSQIIAGTPDYMAPEQAAGKNVTPASDYYAMGVMLYEVLTGQTPYTGTPLAVMLKKQEDEAPDPRALKPEAPADLANLCMELLRCEPSQRPTGKEILALLGTQHEAPTEATLRTQDALPFVGRTTELETLHRAYTTRNDLRPLLFGIEAPSGLGKTLLAEQFLVQLRIKEPDVTVLRSRCYAQESVAFKAFDGLMDSVSRYLEHLPEEEAAMLMPRQLPVLVRLFPALERVPVVKHAVQRLHKSAPHADAALDVLAGDALRELLERLAMHSPTIVFIDDLQWADEDSAQLFAQLLLKPTPPSVMYLFTYREQSEETPVLSLFDATKNDNSYAFDAKHLALKGLDLQDATALVRAAQQEMSPDALMQVVYEAQGHPMLLRELMRGEATPSESGKARSLLDILWARISKVGGRSSELLELIALAGRPLTFATLASASAHEDSLLRELAILRSQSFIRMERGHALPYHDRIREAIEANLSEDQKVQRHGQLASALEMQATPDPEMLAFHWKAAGRSSKAAAYAWPAAETAHESCAFAQASRLYDQALDDGDFDALERTRILERSAECLERSGRLQEAAVRYLETAKRCDGAEQRNLQMRAGNALVGFGDVTQGLDLIKASSRGNGIRWPSLVAVLFSILRFFWWVYTDSIPKLDFRTAHDEQSAEVKGRLNAIWANILACFSITPARYVHFLIRYVIEATRARSKTNTVQALAVLGFLLGSIGQAQLSTRIFAHAEVGLASIKDAHFSLARKLRLFRAFVKVFQMRFAEARSPLEEVMQDVEQTGATDGVFRVPLHIYWFVTNAALGNWHTIRNAIPRIQYDAKTHGDHATFLCAKYLWQGLVDILDDKAGHAEEYYQGALHTGAQTGMHTEDKKTQHLTITSLMALSHNYLYDRNPKRLWELSSQYSLRLGLIASRRLPYIRTRWSGFRTRAALMLASTEQDAQKLWLRRARKELKKFDGFNAEYTQAHAAGLRACLAAAEGRLEEARSQFETSIQMFESGQFALYVAAAKWQLSQLQTGDPSAQNRAEALAIMNERGFAAPEKFPGSVFPLPIHTPLESGEKG